MRPRSHRERKGLHMQRSRLNVIAFLFAAGLVACTNGDSGGPGVVNYGTATVLSVLPVTPVVEAGTSLQLTLEVRNGNVGSQTLLGVTWSSADTTIATVDANGLVTGVAPGTVAISATYQGQSTSQNLVVTAQLVGLALLPPLPDLTVGLSIPFSVIGYFADGSVADVTQKATFNTPSALIAPLTGSTLTGVGAGTVQLTVIEEGLSASESVVDTVRVPTGLAVSCDPSVTLVPSGNTQASGNCSAAATLDPPLTPSGANPLDVTALATWSSSDETIATVSGGTVTPVAAGTVTITAAFTLGTTTVQGTATMAVSALNTITSLAISPSAVVLPVDTSVALTVTATLPDGSTQDVTNFVALALANNSATDSNTYATINLTSVSTELPFQSPLAVYLPCAASGAETPCAGVTATFTNADGSTVSNATPVPVTVTRGLLTGIAATAASSTVAVGDQTTFTVTGSYDDPPGFTFDLTARAMYWLPSFTVLAVDPTGTATGLGGGTVSMTASFEAMKSLDPVAGTMTFGLVKAAPVAITVTP